MASTSSCGSQGQVGKHRYYYDVFLSFKGEDTRKNFTDHLYFSLTQKGIITFRDDERLEKGGVIRPGLLRAIENSKFAIVVFSRNYASSTWCLDELAKIIDCMNTMGLLVFPVFYDVDPSDVRKQKGDFEIALKNHEEDLGPDSEKVQEWRTAMTTAANLCGWDVRDSHQSKIIQEITRDIFDKLKSSHTFSSTAKELVGIDSHLSKLSAYLDVRSDVAVMIGIHGMGGIGKTTLARVVYDRISTQFEASSFIANIREVSKSRGILPLQEQLLSQLLKEQNVKIWDMFHGISFMSNRLHQIKVLLVLDDVDKPDQLKFLAGTHEWFDSGSRIIITSRDQHLLASHGVDHLYKMEELNPEDAFQLFSLKAFRGVNPPVDVFPDLCKEFVTYAGGLPLALEVLGSFLCGRDLNEWKSTLERLQKESENEILDRLEISYEGLRDEEKQIFLDIACFFKGMDKDYAIKVLDSCGFSTAIGIRVLIDKSLISIVGERKLWMHDLLQEMGRNIVRKESPKEPGRRSRLWRNEDIIRVLTKNTATDAVEVINFPISEEKKVNVSPEAFMRMDQLRLLKISNVHLPQGFHFLSNELRHLEWDGYPLNCLPSSFHPDNLVAIDLRWSHIELLWHGTRILDKLTSIDLSHSKSLERIPDLTGAPNLEKLILVGCTSLVEVHSSIWLLKQLIILDMKDCRSLWKLPNIIKMKSLQVFNVSGCYNLKKFPEVEGEIENLSELFLDGTAIEQLPDSIDNLTGLVLLDLTSCKKLKTLPDSICGIKSLKTLKLPGCSSLKKLPEIKDVMENLTELFLDGTAIEQLPESIDNLIGLVQLDLKCCNKLKTLPDGICGLKSLKTLKLSGCSSLKNLPEIKEVMENLLELFLDGTAIEQLPESIDNLIGLVQLDLKSCKKLKTLPDGICGLKSLETLKLSGCSSLKELPETMEVMENLLELFLDGTAIEQLPESIDNLTGLVQLDLKSCKRLKALPDGICGLKSLKTLKLSGCSSLKELPEIMEVMENLSELFLDGTAVEQLPESIDNLTGLILLNLNNCKKLNMLPDSICGLKSLKFLKLCGCKKLKKLPENLAGLECLEELDLGGTALTHPPSSIGLLKKLKLLSFHGCGQPSGLSTGLLNFFFPKRGFDSMCLSLPSLSGLSSLKELNLSNCNLLKGMIPTEIGCLSSLWKLNLSGSNVVSIPMSISQLSKLETLLLVSCTRLQSLPDFPPSLARLEAENCTSLEKFPNPFTHCSSESPLFYLPNCSRLIGNQDGASLAWTWLKTYLQRYPRRRGNSVCLCLPGRELPEWFSHQSRGSSVRIDIPPRRRESTLCGMAFCAVFRLRHSGVLVPAQDYWVDGETRAFYFVLTNENGSTLPFVFSSSDTGLMDRCMEVGSEQLFIVYDSGSYLLENIEKEESITVSVVEDEDSPWDVEISKCGAQLVYEEDLEILGNLNPDVHVSEAAEIRVKRSHDDESCDGAEPSAEEEPPTQKVEKALNNSLAWLTKSTTSFFAFAGNCWSSTDT